MCWKKGRKKRGWMFAEKMITQPTCMGKKRPMKAKQWDNSHKKGVLLKKRKVEKMSSTTPPKKTKDEKKGGKNEHHPSTLKKWLPGPHAWEKKGPWNRNNETTHTKKGFCLKKKRWKKWAPPLHAEKMITWHGKKNAHETKTMKQLSLKRDLASPQKKGGKNEHHSSTQKQKKKTERKKGGKKWAAPPKKKSNLDWYF